MSLTKGKGIGGVGSTRRLSKLGDKILNRGPLQPGSRNARRLLKKLRDKHGDEIIDREIERLKQRS